MEQTFLNWAFGGGMTLLGWLGKTIWDANKELRDDLSKLRESLPEKYVIRTDLDKRFDRLDETLKRIYDILDSKADRHG